MNSSSLFVPGCVLRMKQKWTWTHHHLCDDLEHSTWAPASVLDLTKVLLSEKNIVSVQHSAVHIFLAFHCRDAAVQIWDHPSLPAYTHLGCVWGGGSGMLRPARGDPLRTPSTSTSTSTSHQCILNKQCVYMTHKKTELLCQFDYDWIFKMHVYTLVWLKSDQIGFLIVELKHPDYSIDSGITPACIRSSGLDQILRSVQVRDFSPGPWAGSRRAAGAASFLRNHCKKEHPSAPICVIILFTIYEVCKDVASSRSSYTIFLKCRGSWWHKEVSRRCFCYH